ncbi:arginine-tRNA-protein transferas-like protein 1 [Calycina marina]|uniref:Arginyl-tRNA--protein transferase 1 n=1 Tax=Calycina marina TaxID=1763456 RepID=A0A9P7ZBE0_9HELO|nr:arginine-tRNA-protein transferas-like protein 1 [Calycina marina]
MFAVMKAETPDVVPSTIRPIGYRNNSCGYCHGKTGSFSYYASALSLELQFYEDLLNQGWRRSGTLLYKPDQRFSCCPQYTIRLDSESFHASRDQRQALNRFSKYITGDVYTKEAVRLYPKSKQEAKKRDAKFDLVERVHECEKHLLRSPPEPARKFSVTLEPDSYTDEKFELYANYQRTVHKDPPNLISKQSFQRFLCSSPLPRSKVSSDGREKHLGSYHQCYRIDGELVAFGVLDLLPQCVSAVYFVYDESVNRLSFGKVGALREVALAKEYGYRWWYAGFYIHSCIKMKYKGDYSPQHMLDPESYGWDLLDQHMKQRLDEHKYVSMSSNTSSSGDKEEDCIVPNPDLPIFLRGVPGVLTKEQILAEVDLDGIRIKIFDQEAEACDLITWREDDMDSVKTLKGSIAELVATVGSDLAAEMVVALN